MTGFQRVVKNKAYFKRFQVKFARRRDGKTDYRQRKRLVAVDKNKYATPRYRLVVRLTNTTVINQIVSTNLKGDAVLASAYSSELKNYGMAVGLKNYAAAYATGLLVARRVLKLLKLDTKYKGNEKVDGTIKTVEDVTDSGKTRTFWVASVDEGRNPFKVVLDVGVRPTTTGARIFGSLKGASDGGLNIPHNERRFPGYNRQTKEYNADFHKARIFGQHVADYMRMLKESDEEKYKSHFSQYIKNGLDADKLEATYAKVHKAIRANPDRKAKTQKPHDKKFRNQAKKTLQQFKADVAAKKKARIEKLTRATA